MSEQEKYYHEVCRIAEENLTIRGVPPMEICNGCDAEPMLEGNRAGYGARCEKEVLESQPLDQLCWN